MPQPPAQSDQTLMLAVRAGDIAALDTLFLRHHARLYGFLARLTGNVHAAEDLVQEVFLRILRFRSRYDAAGAFETWLFRIARNVAIDRHSRVHREVSVDALRDIPALQGSPLDAVTTTEDHEALARALAEIPVHHREALLLRAVAGLSHREVAAVLGCSEQASRVRVHRAAEALRTQWQKSGGDRDD